MADEKKPLIYDAYGRPNQERDDVKLWVAPPGFIGQVMGDLVKDPGLLRRMAAKSTAKLPNRFRG